MNEEELLLAIFAAQFEPKLIRLTNGTTYEIRRPGSIAIGQRTSAVVVDGLIHTVANVHIGQVEPLAIHRLARRLYSAAVSRGHSRGFAETMAAA